MKGDEEKTFISGMSYGWIYILFFCRTHITPDPIKKYYLHHVITKLVKSNEKIYTKFIFPRAFMVYFYVLAGFRLLSATLSQSYG